MNYKTISYVMFGIAIMGLLVGVRERAIRKEIAADFVRLKELERRGEDLERRIEELKQQV